MDKVLYQVKKLEKVIARNVVKDMNEFECDLHISKPSTTQMQIIHYIIEHANENIYQKDLENVLNLRRATVSGVLKTMEKNGIIVRKVCADDTRTKKVYLNEKTKEMFFNNINKINELEKIAISGISEEDIGIFLDVINKMRENIENFECNK